MRKLLTLAALVAAVATVGGVANVGDASAASRSCVVYCNQYVRPYYRPSTMTWTRGYFRNSPSDYYRATPRYTFPRYYTPVYQLPTYSWR